MTLAQRIRQMITGMPADASVVLAVSSLEEWLKTERTTTADLALDDVGELFGRSVSTVRGWCQAGLLPGAYKVNGRGWKIPQSAVKGFRDRQLEATRTGCRRGGARARMRVIDTAAWRKVN